MSVSLSHRRRVVRRLAVAGVVALLAWLGSSQWAGLPWVGDLLMGYIGFGLGFAVPVLVRDWPLNAEQTRTKVEGDDPGPGIADLVVVMSALASLLGVGALTVSGHASSAGGGSGLNSRLAQGLLGLAAVAVGWVCIHTTFALRYARLYYFGDADDIDFNTSKDPAFSDFCYFAFNLGMTYQVSDTATTSSAVRRVVLGHCLLAWTYGVFIIGATINLVVGLGQG